jgi:hypothetical protein
MVLEAAEQERRSQHEERVRDDRAGYRSLQKDILPGAQYWQRDKELGQIAQRRVEQAVNQVARLGCYCLSGAAEQSRQRNNGGNGELEPERVRFQLGRLGEEDKWYENQQPQ